MVSAAIEKELHEQLEHLLAEQQRQVLEFARALATAQPRGVPGKDLLKFAGSIEKDELKIMSRAVEEDCERVDADAW